MVMVKLKCWDFFTIKSMKSIFIFVRLLVFFIVKQLVYTECKLSLRRKNRTLSSLPTHQIFFFWIDISFVAVQRLSPKFRIMEYSEFTGWTLDIEINIDSLFFQCKTWVLFLIHFTIIGQIIVGLNEMISLAISLSLVSLSWFV